MRGKSWGEKENMVGTKRYTIHDNDERRVHQKNIHTHSPNPLLLAIEQIRQQP